MNETEESAMPAADIRLMPVSMLLKPTPQDGREWRFFVPDYQRGYRWKPAQVTRLLEDLLTFAIAERDRPDRRMAYYCLQPIVVRRDRFHERWVVIDGQQRLTTIRILLRWFQQEAPAEPALQGIVPYSIEYETRQQTAGDLDNLGKVSCCHVPDESIDLFFLKDAYAAISDWMQGKNEFKDKGGPSLCEHLGEESYNAARLILELLAGTPGRSPTARSLWYAAEEEESENELFKNLNTNKQDLTDAELVKGLFLLKSNFGDNPAECEKEQYRMALKWDRMENALHDDAFWSFLTPRRETGSFVNRIDLLLDLIFRARYVDEHPLSVVEMGLKQDDRAKEYRQEIADAAGDAAQSVVEAALRAAKGALSDGKPVDWFLRETSEQYGRIVKEALDKRRALPFVREKVQETLEEDHAVFNRYSGLFNKLEDERKNAMAAEWETIEKTFRVLEDWFKDPLIYNLVGYLCQTQTAELADLYVRFDALKGNPANNRGTFVRDLDRLIKDGLKKVSVTYPKEEETAAPADGAARSVERSSALICELESRGIVPKVDEEPEPSPDYSIQLAYGDKLVFNLLLLLNIHHLNRRATTADIKPGVRDACKFPFAVLQAEDWDIEHVDSRTSNPLEKADDRKRWIRTSLVDLRFALSDECLDELVEVSRSDETENDRLGRLMGILRAKAGEQEDAGEEKHNISNLVLLDAETNRSYKNALFVTKRREIVSRRENGQYVPETTAYVFFKLFEKDASTRWQWTDGDRQRYANYIVRELKDYLPKPKEQ